MRRFALLEVCVWSVGGWSVSFCALDQPEAARALVTVGRWSGGGLFLAGLLFGWLRRWGAAVTGR